MSRCFPFPPPGYEKKSRVEETDLLAKEKHKEKKNKKDKKDKEKREGKEKNKDKERSKDKHSDKKDRKEKQKDKRDKVRDKNRTSDAKRIEGQPEWYNGEKLGPNSLQPNGIRDSKYVQDLARRIRDEDEATGSQVGQKITITDQRRAELPGRMVERNTNKLEEKEKAKDGKDDDKRVNGQRNYTEARGLGNAAAQCLSGMDQKRFQGIVKPVEKNDIRKQMEEKEKEKEKNKQKESESKGDKHKDRDREKKSRSGDKNRDKEKKKEEKAKEIIEPSKHQLKLNDSRAKLKDNSPKLKDNCKGFPNSCNIKPPDILKMSSNDLASEGSLGKRKELEINGISYDNGIRPNKLPRPVLSSHSVVENGRKLEPCQTDVHFTSESLETRTNNCKVDVKEHKINGLIEVPQLVKSSTKPLSTVGKVNEKPFSTLGQVSEKTLSTVGQVSEKPLSTVAKVGENGEASAKPSHPDFKYLSQILSVPKLEDRYDLDDQEWLFCSNSVQSKKPKAGSPGVDATQNVWAEVLRIENADVTALPFVIPY